MAYLLSILLPGTGHLALRHPITGITLLFLWLLCMLGSFIALSFQVWSIIAFPLTHLALVVVSILHLRQLGRRASQPRFRLHRGIIFLVLGLTLALVVGWTTTMAVVRPVVIRSGSMTPSVVTGNVILVQLFAPRIFGVHLGDIVLVLHPENGRPLIKRILGMEGDEITIRGGELHRNGQQLSQCALRNVRDHETGKMVVERLEVLDHRPYLVWDIPAIRSGALTARVPAGHLFVVGDNRDRSGDSRSFGTVATSSVRGIVSVRIIPVLTNQLAQAPLGARRAASKKCSLREKRSDSKQVRRRKRR